MTHQQIDTLLKDFEEPTAHLQKTRAEPVSLHHEFQQLPLTIQWTPTHSPPRRLTFERKTTGWRPCDREVITTTAITPTHSFLAPADPPTLEDHLNQVQATTRTLTDDL